MRKTPITVTGLAKLFLKSSGDVEHAIKMPRLDRIQRTTEAQSVAQSFRLLSELPVGAASSTFYLAI